MDRSTISPEEAKRRVIDAAGEKLLHDLDGFLMSAYNVYDVARVIPHPYNALASMGNSFLHDFRGLAYRVNRYVESVKSEHEKLNGRG